MTRLLTFISVFVFALVLNACGGGSSDGGAGGSFAGTYNGVTTLTVSGAGVSETTSGTIQIVIDGQGNVTVVDPETDTSVTGTLDGNQFTVAIPGPFLNEPGFTCSGTINVSGTVSGDTITGMISSSGLTCNGVPIQATGPFEAARAPARAARPVGVTMMKSLQNALH